MKHHRNLFNSKSQILQISQMGERDCRHNGWTKESSRSGQLGADKRRKETCVKLDNLVLDDLHARAVLEPGLSSAEERSQL